MISRLKRMWMFRWWGLADWAYFCGRCYLHVLGYSLVMEGDVVRAWVPGPTWTREEIKRVAGSMRLRLVAFAMACFVVGVLVGASIIVLARGGA